MPMKLQSASTRQFESPIFICPCRLGQSEVELQFVNWPVSGLQIVIQPISMDY